MDYFNSFMLADMERSLERVKQQALEVKEGYDRMFSSLEWANPVKYHHCCSCDCFGEPLHLSPTIEGFHRAR